MKLPKIVLYPKTRQYILEAIKESNNLNYGLGIQKHIQDNHNADYSIGFIYTVLDMLEREGKIEVVVPPIDLSDTSQRRGKARRYYRLIGANNE